VFVPSAGQAGLFVVVARADKGPSLFIVERGEGVSPGPADDLLACAGPASRQSISTCMSRRPTPGRRGRAAKMLEAVFALGNIALAPAPWASRRRQ